MILLCSIAPPPLFFKHLVFPCSLQVKFCEYLIAKFFIVVEILFLGDTMQNNTSPSVMEASHLSYVC